MLMKRFTLIISVLFFISSLSILSASAADSDLVIEQAANGLKSWDIFLSGKCKGRVDYPHISRHVKGTVNIALSIDCLGEFTSITGIFFRNPIKSASDARVGHVSGKDKIKMNLAIPCISNEGLSVHSYFVTATFIATRHFPVVKTYSWPVPC